MVNRTLFLIKVKVKALLTKLGIISDHDFRGYKKRRNIILGICAAIALIAILLSFFLGSKYKTEMLMAKTEELAVQNENLKKENEKLSSEIGEKAEQVAALDKKMLEIAANLEKCDQNFTSSETKIVELTNELNDFNDRFVKSNQAYEDKLSDKHALIEETENSLDACQGKVDDNLNIIKSSVRAVCCSYSNIQSSDVLKWAIVNNQIMCPESGEFEVNCGTGITDFE